MLNSLAVILFCAFGAGAQLPRDIIINEILFNPSKDGFDYVELYNRSNESVVLSELMIANRNVTNDLASFKILTKEDIKLPPGNYALITPNEKWLRLNYHVPDSALIIDITSLPSMPDDEGILVLVTKGDTVVVDELHYNAKWHFALLSDVAGVALERINPEEQTQDKNNWTSAASSARYGTPGYTNSQYNRLAADDTQVSVSPKIVSPDNNGIHDFAMIRISARQNGQVVNAVIYDVVGRQVKYLLKNVVLGMNDMFVWKGNDDQEIPVPTGIYILYTQIFDMLGKNRKFKNCIVVQR